MTYIDLSGKWDVFLDEGKAETLPREYPFEINLPDTTSHARLGKINPEKKYGCLTDRYSFEGYAWFRRSFTLGEAAAAQRCVLFLERTRKTAVWLDGNPVGSFCSLCAPHRYDISGISAGTHELIIRVDNTDYPTGGGHLTSQDTQTNWNGITGSIGLTCFTSYPENCLLYPDPDNGTLRVSAEFVGEKCGRAQLRIYDRNGEYACADAEYTDGRLDATLSLHGSWPLWSEHSPNLLQLEISTLTDVRQLYFGMRRLRADGLTLLINGDETFLRGKHDGLVFPKTGYAPTDISEWIKVFEIAKRYGINHYRFHTCCPPEAAFAAADIMGIYLQPELPFWGTIPDEFGKEHLFLREEGFRILREYGSHPSFVMMSMGNELWGNKERLDELLDGYADFCPDKLYVQGSNNFQFVPCILPHDDFFSGVRFSRDRLIRGSYASCDAPFGHIQTEEPNSLHSYDPMIIPQESGEGSDGGEILIQYGTQMKKVRADASGEVVPNVPVISHEVGQYYIYPNYDEIAKYTGSLRHDTYEGYRERAREKGLLPFAQRFFRASGALSVECYREEIETALRSRSMAGFQLLDIQDFPGQGTATVGILDAFMESKGLVEPSRWRSFCGRTVVLAQLERFVFGCGEEIRCGLMISSTEPGYSACRINWRLVCGGKAVCSGNSPVGEFCGRIAQAREITFSLESGEPVSAELLLQVDGSNVTNSYTLWFYPPVDVEISREYIRCGSSVVPITDKPRAGALCIPEAAEDSLRGEYCTDFWCYRMFRSISESMGKPVPTGTLGLLIDTKSTLLAGFPCEEYSTPQWHAIVTHSHCAELDGTDIVPDVWVIDNPQRAKRLALLYRVDGACVCTSRLWEIGERPEVKWFAKSLAEAVARQ